MKKYNIGVRVFSVAWTKMLSRRDGAELWRSQK